MTKWCCWSWHRFGCVGYNEWWTGIVDAEHVACNCLSCWLKPPLFGDMPLLWSTGFVSVRPKAHLWMPWSVCCSYYATRSTFAAAFLQCYFFLSPAVVQSECSQCSKATIVHQHKPSRSYVTWALERVCLVDWLCLSTLWKTKQLVAPGECYRNIMLTDLILRSLPKDLKGQPNFRAKHLTLWSWCL